MLTVTRDDDGLLRIYHEQVVPIFVASAPLTGRRKKKMLTRPANFRARLCLSIGIVTGHQPYPDLPLRGPSYPATHKPGFLQRRPSSVRPESIEPYQVFHDVFGSISHAREVRKAADEASDLSLPHNLAMTSANRRCCFETEFAGSGKYSDQPIRRFTAVAAFHIAGTNTAMRDQVPHDLTSSRRAAWPGAGFAFTSARPVHSQP